jgi:hypothetical protein
LLSRSAIQVSSALFDIGLLISDTLLVLPDVDDSRFELPSRNPTVEQDVEFTVGAALEFRKAEECRDEADASSAAPDVTALASQVPSSGVEHLRRKVDHGDLSDIVCRATNTGAQSTETNRRSFGNDGISNGSEGSGIDEGDDHTQTSLSVVCVRVLRDGGANTKQEEQEDVRGCAPQVDGAAAEPGGKGP